jgi:hypothetical protein
MYVLNNANCVTIVELQSISEHEREKSHLVWVNYFELNYILISIEYSHLVHY